MLPRRLIVGWSFMGRPGSEAIIPISIAMNSVDHDGARRAVASGTVGGTSPEESKHDWEQRAG